MFCLRVLGLFVYQCVVVMCALVYAFAFVCRKLVFRITRVFRCRVCFAFVFLFVCACVYVVCVSDCMRLPLSVASLRFIFHVRFAFMSLACLCVIVCLFLCDCV